MAADGAAEYPAHWAADVLLRDGSTLHIRPIRPTDAEALQSFHLRQSPESVYLRFFAPRPRLSDADLERLTHVDHVDRVALVLVSGSDVVAVGRYDRIDAATAEVAFHVADALQGRGLGSVLLEHLAAAARERGIRRFRAEVLPGNTRMINVFRDAGYDVRQAYDDGVVTVAFGIDPTQRSLDVMAEREQHADAESMRALLGASSVMVVADGPSAGPFARRAAEAVLTGPFDGPVHLVGEALADLAGPTRRSLWVHAAVADVPGPVDLAVVAADPKRLTGLVGAVAATGARGVVVLTGAPDGRELRRVVRDAGLRLVGPESFGLLGDGPAGRLNATLRTAVPPAGGLSLFCQSASAGLALLGGAERRGIGVATFLSAGNRADVSGNDALQFWLGHAGTTAVAVYLESIGNPRKFSRVARRLAQRLPVVAVVAGSTGQAVPPGHPVRTSREPRRVLDDMLRQSGVMVADDGHRLLDVAQLVQSQPLPQGDRVAVVASSGSLGALAAEVCRAQGLRAADAVVLDETADAARYAAVLGDWAAAEDSDALVVAYVPTLGVADPAVLTAIATTAARSRRPVVACVLGLNGLTGELSATGGDGPGDGDGPEPIRTVPAFATVEDAGRALAAVVGYVRWRAAERGEPLRPAGIDQRAARDLVDRVAAGTGPEPRRLAPGDAAALLACYGVRVWPSRVVSDLTGALAAADDLGWPVAVKTCDDRLRHRLDLGGVVLDVAGPEDMAGALGHLAALEEAGARGAPRYEVQAMAPRGVACVVRGVEDPLYGPVVSFGLAGDAVELLEDVSYGVPPLSGADVGRMVRSVRAAPRLTGYRGLPRADLAAVEDVLARVSRLKDDLPEIAEVVLNPVLAAERDVAVLEAGVRLAYPARRDRARRVLPD